MRVQHITVDCVDPYELATFWSMVTGWPICADDEAGDGAVSVEPPNPVLPELLFLRVDEPKTVRNRVRLDLVSVDGGVHRLLAAGASLVEDRRVDGRGWVVVADPEGNEFRVGN